MRRKYDLRNKKSFLIVLVVAILVIGIFSLFIYDYKKISKIEYKIEAGSIVQDVNKNYINIDDEAIIKYRFNGNYYLVYQDNKITLGKKVIVYNAITGEMKLYGKFYEIAEDGKIIEWKNETILANTTDTKFYKIDDREYLLVDRVITSDDKSIEANNYLLVELDKLGNAKLSNNKINLKTITPTILITSKYRFDINNEILNFGKYDINLKKIIGSSNQYVPEAVDDNKNGDGNDGNGTGDGSGTGGTNGGNGNSNGQGGNNSNVINNTGNGKKDEDIDDIKEKTKMTSVVRVSEGLTSIDIDYVIYDPYNEYKSIYAEVMKNGKLEVIYLSKNDTHIVIDNLVPDTEYTINFVYTTIDSETEELVRNTFDRLDLKTKKPKYSIETYSISSVKKNIVYKVYLQEGYSINKVNVSLTFDYYELDMDTNEMVKKKANIKSSVTITNNNSKYVMGTIDIAGYNIDTDTLLELNINSVEGANGVIPISSSFPFKILRR